jgi:adenosylcobinamide-GDP ribazoletransferase
LLLKIASLTSLHGPWQLAALACIPAWSRWCESYAIGKFPYARAYGKGKVWHDSMDYPADLWKGAIPAVLVTAAAAFFWGATTIICPLVFTIMGGIIAAHWLNGKIDGHTGDTYGCVVELAEAAGIALSAVIGSALF